MPELILLVAILAFASIVLGVPLYVKRMRELPTPPSATALPSTPEEVRRTGRELEQAIRLLERVRAYSESTLTLSVDERLAHDIKTFLSRHDS